MKESFAVLHGESGARSRGTRRESIPGGLYAAVQAAYGPAKTHPGPMNPLWEARLAPILRGEGAAPYLGEGSRGAGFILGPEEGTDGGRRNGA